MTQSLPDPVGVPIPVGIPVDISVSPTDVLIDDAGANWQVIATDDQTGALLVRDDKGVNQLVTSADYANFQIKSPVFEVGHKYQRIDDGDIVTYIVAYIDDDGDVIVWWVYDNRRYASWVSKSERKNFVEVSS